ncbi:hypothetical protein BTUL_0132g00260 [Botrytis tulipae]|uniref:Major facilitator superfamily (MFS) profile domain-containing protein n=1 Tax=Botrytis tulipae TaxID=87230 RepID=A0A4Z1EIB8_9HELO|nr:hypothetical protein BTUL_0132g00260 [Botrytis tulipae]
MGLGIGFQSSIVIVQTVLPLSDIPVATAIVSFFQTLNGSIFIAIAQSLFQHGITNSIRKGAPEINSEVFLRNRATQIRPILAQLGAEDKLDVVLQGYVNGLRSAFWITTACAIVGLFVCFGLEWKNIKRSRKGKAVKDDETANNGPIAV